MSSCIGCGSFYVPPNPETDDGVCPRCSASSIGVGYTNKEWVCGDVSGGTFDLSYNSNFNNDSE